MFLALTALEEFWDTSKPLLFLGEWCKDHKKKQFWQNLNASVLQSTKLNYANSYEAYQYAVSVYEKLLPKLASWLNEHHGTKYSLKYWRLLVGPFLFWYTQVIYHRFLYLQAAYEQFPDLETYGLSQDTFFTPMNTNEFVSYAWYNDALNLQIFTQLLNFNFKPPVAYKKVTCAWEVELEQRRMSFVNSSYKLRTRLLLFVLRNLNKLNRCQEVGLLESFSPKEVFKLMVKSGFRILPLLPTSSINRGQALNPSILNRDIVDVKKRNQLLNIATDDELSKLVINTLPVNMPINFIESYQEEVTESKKYFPYTSSVILHPQTASYDQYKFWIGEQMEKGAKLVGYQHGGCYGMQKASSAEFIERSTSDFFISWGWSSSKNVLPAFNSHINQTFISNFYKEKNIKSHEILWVATKCNREYSIAIHDWPIMSRPYLSYQKSFFEKLEARVSSTICMRLDPSSKNVEEIKEYLPNVSMYFPTNRESFFTHLSRAKIVVLDNPSTPLLHILALNVPAILFWDKEHWVFRDEAKPYLEALEGAGIYYDSPEAAANMLNKVIDDPQSWWASESVQSARQQFCDNFTRISTDHAREWKELLLSLSK